MKSALIALVLGLFTVSNIVRADETATAPTTEVKTETSTKKTTSTKKVAKKHKKGKTAEGAAEGTTPPAEEAPAAK